MEVESTRRTLTDGEARWLEAVGRLHAHAIERFYERRRIEWRLAFTLWGGLALAANGLADADLDNTQAQLIRVGLVLLVLAHLSWEWRSFLPAARSDRLDGYRLSAVQEEVLGLPANDNPKVGLDRRPKRSYNVWVAHAALIVVTAVLCAYVWIIV